MFIYIFIMGLMCTAMHAMENTHSPELAMINNDTIGNYVLSASGLIKDSQTESSAQETFAILDDFFKQNNIKDYADAAKFGKETSFFKNPDAFNQTMGTYFKKNINDIYPETKRCYQAVIMATSGIDVFMERLAFLNRLIKTEKIQTDAVVALVGNHNHRNDLRNLDYLMKLPHLFEHDFDLKNFDKEVATATITPSLEQKNWIHKDGMHVALQLVSCDETIAQLRNKLRYFSGQNNENLRTEQLIEHLLKDGLDKPLSKENPIAFIANAQGAAKTKEMITKLFPDNNDAVDLLVARPVAEEIEGILYNDTPQQRAMTKMFHYYRILESIAVEKK